jgi:hypothetical protein
MKSSSNLILASFWVCLISACCWNSHAASSTLGGVGIVIGNACTENGATVFNDSPTHIVVCAGGIWTAYSGGGSISFPIDADTATTPLGLLFDMNSGTENLLSIKGTSNIFLGRSAGQAITTGSYNTFVGTQAGGSNSTGNENSFFGDLSGLDNTSGNRNSGYGAYSLENNTSGGSNTAAGWSAGLGNTDGTNNVYLGNQSGINNQSGDFNVMLGSRAGFNSFTTHTADNNIFIGYWTGRSTTSGARNIFLGTQSGIGNTTGADNVFIGFNAGNNNTTGSKNILIGHAVSNLAATTSNYLKIGTDVADAIRGTIGTGNLSAQGAAWDFHSDQRMKDDIQTITTASDSLEKIRGVKFRWKPEFNRDQNYHYGVVAQEVQKVFPELVTTAKSAKDNKEYLEVAYNGFFAVLIEAFKEANAKIKAIVADVSSIQKQLNDQAVTIKQQQTLLEHQQLQIEQLNQKLNLLMKNPANQEKAKD